MKRNILETYDKGELVSYLSANGKQATANYYNVSLSQIINWCKKHNIKIIPYKGLKKTEIDEKIEDIKELYCAGYSLSAIGRIYNTSHNKIKRLLLKNGIQLNSCFDVWKTNRNNIKENIDLYIKENKEGLNISEIALKYNISYEVLKTELQKMNYEVILYSYNKSHGELQVKEFIESLGFDCNSIKKTYDGKTYEIDCFIEEKNIGIEYCGEYWHSIEHKNKKYHQEKFKWCLEQGITLITVFEHEWYTKQDLLKSMLKQRLGIISRKIFARKTEVLIISQTDAKKFHDENHIQGGLTSSYLNIALVYENEYQLVLSIGKSRFDKKIDFEILRLSSKKNTIVIGGFSKAFKKFLELEDPKSILSYCDLRFGIGSVYETVNFMKIAETPPNYWYYYKKNGKTGKLESRLKYQKHKLKHFSNYSDKKTETQIMLENGYFKIYDCGNYKYIWKREP